MDKKNTPEVKLGQYKGLAVTRHVRPVTDKTVDIELVHQARMHAVYHPTTEPARRGFRALLDFAGYMDGKEIPDSRMEKVMVVLGDGKLMPAAEQAIYGHRAGEVFRFDFTYRRTSACRSCPARPHSSRSSSALWPRKSRPHRMRLSPGVWASTPSTR